MQGNECAELKLKLPLLDWRMRTKARRATQFDVRIDNRGYAASLEIGKLYRVIPDEQASKHGYICVVDESGEDYGYAAQRFFVLKVPQPIARL